MNIERRPGEDPAASLALVREARRSTAARAKAPSWYHPALGAVIGVLVASLESSRYDFVSASAIFVIAILAAIYQKRTGVWLNGFTAGGRRPRSIAWLGTLAAFAAIGLGLWLRFSLGIEGAMIWTGIGVGLFMAGLGLAWERAFLAEAGA